MEPLKSYGLSEDDITALIKSGKVKNRTEALQQIVNFSKEMDTVPRFPDNLQFLPDLGYRAFTWQIVKRKMFAYRLQKQNPNKPLPFWISQKHPNPKIYLIAITGLLLGIGGGYTLLIGNTSRAAGFILVSLFYFYIVWSYWKAWNNFKHP